MRTHQLGEADRIITFLTRHHGIVRATAKGVRRTRSKFGARLEPFSLVDVQFYEGRSLDIVTEVATLAPFSSSIARDIDSYAAASSMLEVAEQLCSESSEDEHFFLLLAALAALARRDQAADLIRDSYFLRALAVAGWALSIWNCAECGANSPTIVHLPSGGLVCDSCAPRDSRSLPAPVIAHLGALMGGQWEAVRSSSNLTRGEASQIVANFLQWQLERQVRSLRVGARMHAAI